MALLLAGGIALAANISVRYFGDAGSRDAPWLSAQGTRVRGEPHIASAISPYRLALPDTVAAYSYSSESGGGTVYMAPYCTTPASARLLPCPDARRGRLHAWLRAAIATTTMSGFQPWNFAFTPDIHALLGRLSPSAAGSSVEVTFEDGTNERIATHGRLFAYAVAGERTRAGHRPIRVSVIHGASRSGTSGSTR